MAGTTTYYGVTYPTSTDYVKDGATAIQTVATGFDSAVAIPTYNAQTGATYTFALTDVGKTVTASNASASTYTIPPTASVAWPANTTLDVVNLGAGVVTFAAGAGVTVTNTAATLAQYASAALIRTGLNAWTVTPTSGASAKILQVVSTTKTDTFSMSSSTFADITGLTATITPSTNTSKILVMYHSSIGNNLNNTVGWFRLTRGGTAIGIGDAAGSRIRATTPRVSGGTVNNTSIIAGNFLDSPATTSATTYALQIASETPGVSVHVNRGDTDTDSAAFARGISTITLMEVSA